MRAHLALTLVFSAFVVLGTAAPAHAETEAEAAKKHFEAGRKLRAEGDCAKAIPEFEKSLAADKSIGGYYNLGYCEEQLGQRQEAYEAYRRAREMASVKKDERLKEISGALAALMETPNIRLVLPQPLPPGFTLSVDGEAVPAELYQTETVVFTKSTPTHEVRASAPGFNETKVVVDTKQLRSIEMKETAKATALVPPPPPPAPHEPPFYRRPLFGGVLGISGFIALSAGVIIGVRTQQEIDKDEQPAIDARNRCSPTGTPLTHAECTAQSGQRRDDYLAKSKAYNQTLEDGQRTFAFVILPLLAGGALLVGAGTYVLLTAKSAAAEARAGAQAKPPLPTFTPMLAPGLAGGSLRVAF